MQERWIDFPTHMQVNELDPTAVEIDIPVGGFGGECDRKDYTRNVNTVTRVETIHEQIGDCVIQADVTTELTFFGDDSVTGFETMPCGTPAETAPPSRCPARWSSP